MTVLQDVKKEFADRTLDRHGIRLLRASDAAEYVSRCAEHGIDILGIDGFLVNDDKLQPMMEHSLDLTILGPPGGADRKAMSFLQRYLDSELWFEVVVEE